MAISMLDIYDIQSWKKDEILHLIVDFIIDRLDTLCW